MTRRTIGVGLLGGLLISLAAVYPLIGMVAPVVMPGWQVPMYGPLLHSILLMISAAIGLPVFFLGGAWAAHRAPAYGLFEGIRAGALAGATAGAGCYITIISPLSAMIAYGEISRFIPRLVAAEPVPPRILLRYVAAFDNLALSLELTLLVFVAVWALAGAVVGWRKGERPQHTRPTLYSLVAAGKQPSLWFSGDESALKVGLRVGVAIGLLALVTTFGWFYAGFAQDLPEFEAVIQGSRTGMVTGPLTQGLAVLSPLLTMTLFVYGLLIVALITNPRDRYSARTGAIMLASIIIATFISAVGLRIIYFNIGLSPFMMSQIIRTNPEDVSEFVMQLQYVLDSFAVPALLVAATMILAWSTVIIAILGGLFFGSIQSFFSTMLLPLFIKRPVDRTAVLQRHIKRQPEEVLPHLYNLCLRRKDAYEILVHLAIRTFHKMPAVSHLSAAYHTLGTSFDLDDHLQTVEALRAILAENPQWRWAQDFGNVYNTLHEVLNAHKLDDILAIQPLATQQTVSLPSQMARSMQHINRIIIELQKSKKVDDLPTRLIFMENGLSAIHEAQRFVLSEMGEMGETAVTLPQRAALADALDHWQGMVLKAVRQLKGRADLSSNLQSQHCTHCVPLPLVWQIQNNGLNVAQEIRLRVLPGQGYAVDNGIGEINILPPGEERLVTLTINPQEQMRRLRIEWEILYDDAVVDDRRLTFADVVEFNVPERPFQRVFPIPYVTGTPLKTDDVFVGREDVFAFIRENLLGSHQNNVIILHGQRRTGKTSVLYRLGQVMAETHVGVLIDMQGKPARSEVDFLYSIADDIVFALEDDGIQVPLPNREDFVESPEFYFRARFLRSLYPHLKGKHLLFLFDEFEELQRRVENGRLQPEIFQFLRNLMQHEEQIDFVFSGTHRLEDLSADYWSILFNIAAYKPITFLSPAEVQRLITQPVAEYGIEYDPLAAERITQVTAGHPYFTQLILHEMMVYHNETERSYFTVSDVDLVLERIIERGEAHFKHIWAESTPEEHIVMQGVAELLHDAEVVDVVDLRTFLRTRGYKSKDDWGAALASCNGRDILTRSTAKSSRYRFKVDLIRLWIDRTRPAL